MASEVDEGGVLPVKIKRLTALGCVLALRRQDQIGSCTNACLESGATVEEVMEVLRLATVMTECPGDAYRPIILKTIEAFGQ